MLFLLGISLSNLAFNDNENAVNTIELAETEFEKYIKTYFETKFKNDDFLTKDSLFTGLIAISIVIALIGLVISIAMYFIKVRDLVRAGSSNKDAFDDGEMENLD